MTAQARDTDGPFCFEARRMPRRWRQADREADRTGIHVHLTIGSSTARREWFDILLRAIASDELIRIRHRYYDDPAILMKESRFRALEREAANARSNEPLSAEGGEPTTASPPRGLPGPG